MVKSDPSHHSLTYVLSCSECQTCGHNYSKSFMSLTTACHKLSFGRSFFLVLGYVSALDSSVTCC